MNSLRRWLGPEIYWLTIYLVIAVCGRLNAQHTDAGNQRLEWAWWLVPLLAVPVCFAGWGWAEPHRGWMLVRINVASCVGLWYVASRLATDIHYGDSRDSGTGSAWVMSLILGMAILMLADVIMIIVGAMSSRRAN